MACIGRLRYLLSSYMWQLYEKTDWTLLQKDKKLLVLPRLDAQRLERVDMEEQEALHKVHLYLQNPRFYLQNITFCYSRSRTILWHTSLAKFYEWGRPCGNFLPC